MLIEPVTGARALLPGYVRLCRRIVYEQQGAEPELLWFDVPEEFTAGLGTSGDGWLVALLPLALRMREPLRIAAMVDPTLLRNTGALMKTWAGWFPEYPPVRVEVEGERARADSGAGRTGLFFTGGVDSFYSALHYDRQAARDHRTPVEDLLYIWGYDIPLENQPAFERKARTLAEVADRMGKRAITLATNLRQTRLATLDWARVTHGAALGAAALMLEGRFSTMLLSAALAREDSESFGAHPLTDPLMSTGRTTFVHYGAEATRFEKTEFIASSELVRRYLHVCWEEASDRNCSRCEKCFRTQMTLDLLGCREAAPCFDVAGYSLDRADRVQLGSPATVRLMRDLRGPAMACGRPDVLAAIDRCLEADRRLRGSDDESKWRRRARKWRRSFSKRWLAGQGSFRYWAATVVILALTVLQLADCWIDPDLVPWW
jgi:hypothetical protein